jgi:hypothetical protein
MRFGGTGFRIFAAIVFTIGYIVDLCRLFILCKSANKTKSAVVALILAGVMIIVNFAGIMTLANRNPAGLTYIWDGSAYVVTGYNGNGTSVAIPATHQGHPVRGISSNAFANNTRITSVSFGSNIQNIGNGAFKNCSGLTVITMPSSLRTIGAEAFYNCRNLSIIRLNNNGNLNSIGREAFAVAASGSAVSTVTISIPLGVSIGESAFAHRNGTLRCAPPTRPTTWHSSWSQNYLGTITWSASV